jgi:hypothetical protein
MGFCREEKAALLVLFMKFTLRDALRAPLKVNFIARLSNAEKAQGVVRQPLFLH